MKVLRCSKCLLVASTMWIGTAFLTLVQAQDVTSQQGESSVRDDTVVIEEIVVTGQKRLENVQDIPKQVAVASSNDLKTAGVNRLTDIQYAFPTVTAQQNQTGSSPRPPGIRGIAPFSFSVGVQSQTGIVLDDVPQATFSTLAFELADIERIEVFAGPQTTLSGRNASAGLINIVTRSPSFEQQIDVSFDQTTDRHSRSTVFTTGPIAEDLAYSLSLLVNDWDGPYRNALLNNMRVGGFDTRGARGKILWEPNDGVSATLTGYYLATDRLTTPVLARDVVISGPETGFFSFDTLRRPLTEIYPGIEIGNDNRNVYSPENGIAETNDSGGSLKVDVDVGEFGTFSSITSYSESSQPRTDIFIGSPRDFLVFPVEDVTATADIRTKNFTQEVRLVSEDSGDFSYLIGGIYSRIRLNQLYIREELFPFAAIQDVDTDSAAIFARGTYQITSSDSVTAGLRFQHDKLGYFWQVLTAGDTVSQGVDKNGFWGGEVSYSHKIDNNVNVYMTYSRAETGNAYNMNDVATASTGASLPVIPSTKVNNYEAGVKSRLFGDRLTLNLDVFHAKYRNFQVQDTRITGNSIKTDLLAIGSVVTQGVEMQATYHPNTQLSLGMSGAFIDAKVTDYPNAACYLGQTEAEGCVQIAPGVFRQGNIAGNQLPYSPKWRLVANADYIVPAGKFDVTLGGFYRYQSKSTSDLFGDPKSEQGGYGVVNIHAGVASKDGGWSLEFYVNNLFNKRNYTDIMASRQLIPNTGADPVLAGILGRNSFRYAGVRLNFSM